jgi:hypothetical protein
MLLLGKAGFRFLRGGVWRKVDLEFLILAKKFCNDQDNLQKMAQLFFVRLIRWFDNSISLCPHVTWRLGPHLERRESLCSNSENHLW